MVLNVFNSNILKGHQTLTSIHKNTPLPPAHNSFYDEIQGIPNLENAYESKFYVGIFNCTARVYVFQCNNKSIIIRCKTTPKEEKGKV